MAKSIIKFETAITGNDADEKERKMQDLLKFEMEQSKVEIKLSQSQN